MVGCLCQLSIDSITIYCVICTQMNSPWKSPTKVLYPRVCFQKEKTTLSSFHRTILVKGSLLASFVYRWFQPKNFHEIVFCMKIILSTILQDPFWFGPRWKKNIFRLSLCIHSKFSYVLSLQSYRKGADRG